MTAATPAETPPSAPPSDLMALVLAYKSGDADWPTTKAALLAFPYVTLPPEPKVGDPEYGEWAGAADGFTDYPPNSYGELTQAAYRGQLEWDRFVEINDALLAAAPKAKS